MSWICPENENSCWMPAKSNTFCNHLHVHQKPSASYMTEQFQTKAKSFLCHLLECWQRNIRIAIDFVIQTSMFHPSTFPTFVLGFLSRNVQQVLTFTLYSSFSLILSVNIVRHLQLIAENSVQPLLWLGDRASLQPLLWLADRAL